MSKPTDKPVARREDYTFEVCDKADRAKARDLVKREHYTGSSSFMGTIVCAKRDGQVVAAAQFLPPLPPAAKKHAKTDPKKVTNLSRLVVASGEPQNVATMLIGASLRLLKKDRKYDTVLTFADMSRGHTGAIYKATNAQSCGVSRAAPFWVDPSTGRRVSAKATKTRTVAQMKALGYERQVSPGKHCFKWELP